LIRSHSFYKLSLNNHTGLITGYSW